MSLILVVESEGRHAERVRDGLWSVAGRSKSSRAARLRWQRSPIAPAAGPHQRRARWRSRDVAQPVAQPTVDQASIALLPEVVGRDLGPLEADET